MLYYVISFPRLCCFIVVVEKIYSRSHIFSCIFKGLYEEVFSNGLGPDRFPEGSLIHDLVDHIPGIDDSRVISLHKVKNAMDVAFKPF